MLEWTMPEIVPGMEGAVIERIYPSEGQALGAGAKLFDLSVDLSNAFAQGCPPISYFRVVLREPVRVRKILVQPGELVRAGALTAVFATGDEADADGAAKRQVRIATAGIMHHDAMWSASR